MIYEVWSWYKLRRRRPKLVASSEELKRTVAAIRGLCAPYADRTGTGVNTCDRLPAECHERAAGLRADFICQYGRLRESLVPYMSQGNPFEAVLDFFSPTRGFRIDGCFELQLQRMEDSLNLYLACCGQTVGR